MQLHPTLMQWYRDFQIEGHLALYNYFEEANGNPLLCYPTGTGKSFLNAGIAFDILMKWPNQRILMLTHVKKLIEQNLEKLLMLWPNAPVGIYSAGLNQKDTIQPLIFGAVASVVNNIAAFGHRDLIIIDEAHLVSPDENTMYQIIIKCLTEINPFLKVIGLTATPYRAGQGLLTETGLFTDICFDLTGIGPFNRFIEEGYLAPLIPKRTNIEIDTSDIKINRGDFAQNQLNDATEKVLYEALKETVERAYDRNCWLVFCSGIKPSEHAAEILQSFGVSALAIHSKLTDSECDKRFEAFQRGEVKAIVGNNKFTTGFDFAPIDFICMLRSTMSTNLWVQMLGRGTRPYDCNNTAKYIQGFDYVKQNCLVLDFGGNSKRLGPVNDPQLPRKKGDKEGEMPIKICDNNNTKDNKGCGIYNHPSARFCGGKPYLSNEGCGAEFVFKTKLVKTAGTDELIRGINFEHTIETFNVDKVIYHRHNKIGSEPSIKVSYWSGLKRFTEYVCPQHKGYAFTRFKQWWFQRTNFELPKSTDEALVMISQLRTPKQIVVRTDTQYPEILKTEW